MPIITSTQVRTIEAIAIDTASDAELLDFLRGTEMTLTRSAPTGMLAGILHPAGAELSSARRILVQKERYLVKASGVLARPTDKAGLLRDFALEI